MVPTKMQGVRAQHQGPCTHLGDQVELVHVVLAGEERLAAQQLGKDAAHGPGG